MPFYWDIKKMGVDWDNIEPFTDEEAKKYDDFPVGAIKRGS